MASNETSKYKLSVVEGTELKLSLNGAQGPAGAVGPAGPAATGSFNSNADTLALRDSEGRLQSSQFRLKKANESHYTQINPSSNTESVSFNFPLDSGTIASDKTAVMQFGDQLNINGAKTFSGQVQLTGQTLTNEKSVLTRELGDSRYGLSGAVGNIYTGVNNQNVNSDNYLVPVKLASVTLPVGTYHIDSLIAAYALLNSNGGYKLSLRASSNIRTSLVEYCSTPGSSTIVGNSPIVSDGLLLTSAVLGSSSALAFRRHLTGIIEVITPNTEVSIEFSPALSPPSLPPVVISTRKHSYITARKLI
jgi:hypothetical protein